MKNLISIFTVIIFVFSCTPESKKIPLKDFWTHVEYQEKEGKENVINEYVELLKENPNSPEAYVLLSRVCTTDSLKEYDLLKDAYRQFPNNTFVLGNLGAFYINNNFSAFEKEEGAKLCLKALKIDNSNVIASISLYNYFFDEDIETASLEEQKRRYNKAVFYLSSALKYKQSSIYFTKDEYEEIINLIKNKLKKIEEKIELRERLCSMYEHEDFIRERYKGLGYSIYQINLLVNNNCKYGWYIISSNKYGRVSTCQMVTAPNYETEKIEVESVDCY